VFLFSDAQAKEEYMMEDIGNLLNSGEVPNLFPPDELLAAVDLVRSRAAQADRLGDGTPGALFSFFTDLVRRNLHVVLCMSPASKLFRTRLRAYPSLINCCTIDWVAEWPCDALQAVAQRSFADSDVAVGVRPSVIELCLRMHRTATETAELYGRLERRTTHVTPTSFMELLATFRLLLVRKRLDISTQRQRYSNGLDRLRETSELVTRMRVELEALQPQLVIAQGETDSLLAAISVENAQVAAVRERVAGDEAVADEAAQESKGIRDECEAALAMAIPALKAAIAALDTLKPADISVVKTMKSPPDGVKQVMEAICILKDIKPIRALDQVSHRSFSCVFYYGVPATIILHVGIDEVDGGLLVRVATHSRRYRVCRFTQGLRQGQHPSPLDAAYSGKVHSARRIPAQRHCQGVVRSRGSLSVGPCHGDLRFSFQVDCTQAGGAGRSRFAIRRRNGAGERKARRACRGGGAFGRSTSPPF
jgi:hypothetical protein